jgi:hypothetical protein
MPALPLQPVAGMGGFYRPNRPMTLDFEITDRAFRQLRRPGAIVPTR